MNSKDFEKIKIPNVLQPAPSQAVTFNVNNPTPVGWLVISRDIKTGTGVKMALYNKLPNKFQQFCIKLFFGWWVEKESESIQ